MSQFKTSYKNNTTYSPSANPNLCQREIAKHFETNIYLYKHFWAIALTQKVYQVCYALIRSCSKVINSGVYSMPFLTHWGRVTHICVGKLTIIGSDNGLSPERRQYIWTNAGILLIGTLGTTFSEILIEIQTFSLKKLRLKMSSAKCCSFRLGLDVLNTSTIWMRVDSFTVFFHRLHDTHLLSGRYGILLTGTEHIWMFVEYLVEVCLTCC